MNPYRPLAIAISALVLTGACSSLSSLPIASGPEATDDELPTEPAGSTPARGSWSGTVTVRLVGHFHDELAGMVYDRTGEVTDSYTLQGQDPPALEGGTDDVELEGSLENVGTQDEFNVNDFDDDNATGCKWHTHEEWTIAGSWNRSTSADGEIEFRDDGTYVLSVSVGDAPGTGFLPESPLLPKRYTAQHTIQSRAQFSQCPSTELFVQDTEDPAYWEWATYGISTDSFADFPRQAERIGGTGMPSSSVLDGSADLTLYMPDAEDVGTVTVTWHLAHQAG